MYREIDFTEAASWVCASVLSSQSALLAQCPSPPPLPLPLPLTNCLSISLLGISPPLVPSSPPLRPHSPFLQSPSPAWCAKEICEQVSTEPKPHLLAQVLSGVVPSSHQTTPSTLIITGKCAPPLPLQLPDEVLTVIRRVDDNWAEGMLGDKVGIFPLLYVELNDSAKQLIEMDKLCPAAVTASNYDALLSSDPSPVASVASGPTLSSSGAVSAFQRRVDSKKNAKKRHSFTALSVTHKSSQAASHRHSMEISAPVLISSSDPRAAARIGELAHLSCPVPTQVTPRAQYLALYAYKPQKNDELELRKGEMYRVLEKCQDGWFKGASLKTGVSGVFPGNYVTPVSRIPGGGAGSPWNNVLGGSPLAKGMATIMHPGGGSLSSPATATRTVLPLTTLQDHMQHPATSLSTGSCLRHTAQSTVNQAGGTTNPTATHSSAQALDRPTATVSPLRTQTSPSRLPTTSLRPRSMVSPQHSQHPPTQMCPRTAIPFTSAASAITPPNVSAANLSGEVGGAPISGLTIPSPINTGNKPDDKKNEKVSGPFWANPEPEAGWYRVVVSYPPQSEAEIELKEGDIVFVHKKHEDGWFKGTLQRNGRTGLFPGSFVESF
ncbi:Sh3rf3 [Phodopus roborovskii]|uniref:RING-type E3 ubiquitin transferase n=1 Tax=Phodopus roborovskii TaxID=109678 RepID=A0AAU9ZD45_PHORO|nr:Sh3rf3 [Phodopus roborovskii]